MKKFAAILTILVVAILTVAVGRTLSSTQMESESVPVPTSNPAEASSSQMSDAPRGRRPLPIWEIQWENTFAKNSLGTFGAKAILIWRNEILIFTEMQSSLTAFPQVEVVSSNIERSERSASTSLMTGDIQSFAKIGQIELGVIRFPLIDQPDQNISLRAASRDNQGWQITPLRQLRQMPDRDSIDFFRIPNDLSGLEIHAGSLGPDNNAVLEVIPVKDATLAPMFFSVDSQGNVSEITSAEYKLLTAPYPELEGPGEGEDLELVTPVPLEKEPPISTD